MFKKFILNILPWLIIGVLSANGQLSLALMVILLYYLVIYICVRSVLKILDYCLFSIALATLVSNNLLFPNKLLLNYFWLYVHLIFVIVISITMLLHKPFTIAYAKEITSSEKWHTRRFLLINQYISAIWLSYFLITAGLRLYFYHQKDFYLDGMLQNILLIITIMISKKFPNWYLGFNR